MDGGNRMMILRSLSVVMISLIAGGLSCSAGKRSEIDCEIHEGRCSYEIKGTEVILDIKPKPVTSMTELEFTVQFKSLETEPPETLLLFLTMPRMDMGENKVILKRTVKGIHRGQGVIVACPSGEKEWMATVWVPDLGEAKYVFNIK